MKRLQRQERLAALLLLIMGGTALPLSAAVPPSVTIRTSIVDNQGNGPNLPGSRAYRVRYFDAESGGNQLGSAINGTTTIPSDGKLFLDVVPPAEILTAPAVFYDLAIDSDAVANGLDANDLFLGRIPVNSVPFALKAGNTGTLDDAYDSGGNGNGKLIDADTGPVTIVGPAGQDALVVTSTAQVNALEAADEILVDGAFTADKLANVMTKVGDLSAELMADEPNGASGIQARNKAGATTVTVFGTEADGGRANFYRPDSAIGASIAAFGTVGGGSSQKGAVVSGFYPSGSLSFILGPRPESGAAYLKMFNMSNQEVVRLGNNNDVNGQGAGIFSLFKSDGTNALIASGNTNPGGTTITLFNNNQQRVQLAGGDASVAPFLGILNNSNVQTVALTGGMANAAGLVEVKDGTGADAIKLDGANGSVTAKALAINGDIFADAANTQDHTAAAGAKNGQAKAFAFVDDTANMAGLLVQDEAGKHKVEAFGENAKGGQMNLLREDGVNGLEFNAQNSNHPTIRGNRVGGATDFEFVPRADGNGSSVLKFFNLADKEVVRVGNGNDAQGDGHGVISVYGPTGLVAGALSGNSGGNGGLLSLFNGAGDTEVVKLDAENKLMVARGEVQTENASATKNVRLVGGDTDDGGLIRVMHGNGLETAQIYGGDNALGGQITLTNLGNKDTMALTGGIATEGGELVVGNAGGSATGQLYGGDTGKGALLTLANQAGVARFEATGGDSADGAVLSMTTSSNKSTVELRAGNTTDGASLNLWNAAVANALQTIKLEGGDSALGGEFNFFNTANGVASLTMKGGTTAGRASITLWNAAATQPRVNLDANTGNIDARGAITALDAAGNRAAFLDPSGSVNVVDVLAYQSASSSTVTAGIIGSTGEVFGNTKNFLVPDPTDSTRMIKYTSLEGPEAAMYIRGTASLLNGKATITYPSHFAALLAPDTVTVQLTPRSEDSEGLAAKNITPTSFEVVELRKGNGSYEFDYFVQGVRKGYEKYDVYLSRQEANQRIGRKADATSLDGKTTDSAGQSVAAASAAPGSLPPVSERK